MKHDPAIEQVTDRRAAIFGNMNEHGPGFPDTFKPLKTLSTEREPQSQIGGTRMDIGILLYSEQLTQHPLRKAGSFWPAIDGVSEKDMGLVSHPNGRRGRHERVLIRSLLRRTLAALGNRGKG
ncbi:hypothetical protein AA3266_1157 [Gluconobacter kondonii NBRC 3266]|nr:hypothetical protein AA3266_1157 [Gluconobacter kondonii NBRC 3266]